MMYFSLVLYLNHFLIQITFDIRYLAGNKAEGFQKALDTSATSWFELFGTQGPLYMVLCIYNIPTPSPKERVDHPLRPNSSPISKWTA